MIRLNEANTKLADNSMIYGSYLNIFFLFVYDNGTKIKYIQYNTLLTVQWSRFVALIIFIPTNTRHKRVIKNNLYFVIIKKKKYIIIFVKLFRTIFVEV